jgi:hypothetical protein
VLDAAAERSKGGVRALLDCGALLSGTSNRYILNHAWRSLALPCAQPIKLTENAHTHTHDCSLRTEIEPQLLRGDEHCNGTCINLSHCNSKPCMVVATAITGWLPST